MDTKQMPAVICLLFVITATASFSALSPAGNVYNGLTRNAVINGIDNKLYASADTFLYVFNLYPDSGLLVSSVPVQVINCTSAPTMSIGTMALDVMRKKLYVGLTGGYGHIYIYAISDSGLLINPPTYHSHKAGLQQVGSMYLDLTRNLLVTCGADTTGNASGFYGVVISQLGNDGMPLQSQGDTYNYGYVASNYPTVMVPDLALGKLYRGYSNWKGSIVNLSNGYPVLSPPTESQNDYGGQFDILSDPANKRLYISHTFDSNSSWMRKWNLDDAGNPTSFFDDTPVLGKGYFATMAVDSARGRLYVADNYGNKLYYCNLDEDGKIGSIADSGTISYPLIYGFEPYYNKLYAGGSSYIRVYNGPDSALAPIVINNGETFTEIPFITLKLQSANPAFVYISGDLLSVGSPVSNLNQWVSCGGGVWKNSAGDTGRASTLNVSAVLSTGIGEKTVEVWYCGSTSKCFNGMMRKASAKIILIETNASISSVNLSRIDYSGARIDYTVIDGRNRNVNIDIEYRTSTKDWADANAGSGSEGISGVTATLNGTSHYFIWDIEKDIEANAKDVQVRLKAENGDSSGVWVETQKYSVPDWTGNDLRAINVSIRKQDRSYMYRARVEWSGTGDTSATYELQKREDNGSWSSVTAMTGTMIEVENLSETPVYAFRARLRTKEGLFSEYSKIVSVKLTYRQAGTAKIGKTGGKIYIEDFDENDGNNSRIEIDDGTFREDVDVTLEAFPGSVYEIHGLKTNKVKLIENDFRKPVTVKLRYDKEEITGRGWKEDELAIFYLDGLNWFSIGGTIDKVNYLVTAKVKHFSTYKVAKNYDKPAITVVPDYFSPNNDGIGDVLYFYFNSQEMLEKCEISVYDINGKIVRKIKQDGTNMIYWDGRTESNELCESGLYVCVIESSGKKLTKTVNLVK